MVSESSIVLLCFTMLHVAFVMNVIATASTYWVECHVTNKSLADTREGLWSFCNQTACSPIPKPYSTWFISTLVIYPTGALLSLLATVLYYMFCMTTRGRQWKGLIVSITMLTYFSVILLVISLAVFGKQSTSTHIEKMSHCHLGWAFIVATVGLVFTFCAATMSAWEMSIMFGKRKAYIDL